MVFHARHLVRLVARSWMMVHDLDHHDPLLLPEHLSRVIAITGEADMAEIQEKSSRLLAELPDLGQVEINSRILNLQADILEAYRLSRHLLRDLVRH